MTNPYLCEEPLNRNIGLILGNSSNYNRLLESENQCNALFYNFL